MYYEKEQAAELFKYWNKRIAEFTLPEWDELPVFEVYMDQVVTLMNDYLDIYSEVNSNTKGITPSMINNYVKLKIIPAPIKKKYSRIHLAYLIIVCVLKQTLSISSVQSIIPPDLTEDEVKAIYSSFVKNQHKSYSYVSESIDQIANSIFVNENGKPERINDLIIQVASSANIFKLISENILGNSKNEEE